MSLGISSYRAAQPIGGFASAVPKRSSAERDALGVRPTQDSYAPLLGDPAHADGAADGQAAATPADPAEAKAKTDGKSAEQVTGTHDQAELTTDELQVIAELRSRDRNVRAHEAAHQSAGAGLVGGASYSFQTGPDGRRYAIGGEVSVSVSAVTGDPAATIRKMQQVRAAALAPADPSGQDLAVASAAAQNIAAAQQELTRMHAEGDGQGKPKDKPKDQQTDQSKEQTDEKKGAGKIGVKADELPVILGRKQRQIQAAYAQRHAAGTRVDLNA